MSFEIDPETDRSAGPPPADLDAPGGELLGDGERVANIEDSLLVDTMMAHLAGGLGRPVWTLLAFAHDWC
ncbi:MAG: hypothetical protein OXH75_29255 [Acidobacteria bacterium]|nr:hypothetical protein [Acidobacteriota bacterium]